MDSRLSGVVVAVAYLLVFLLINFDRDFGLIFSIMGIVAYLIYKDDHSHQIPLESNKSNRLESIAWSMIFYGIFIALNVLIITTVAPYLLSTGTTATQSILGAQASQVPALSDSRTIVITAWSSLIPFIETIFFFVVALEFLSDVLKISLSKSNLNPFNPGALSMWLLFIIVSAGFAFFHLSSKAGVSMETDLIITFTFGLVSCFMNVWFGESKQSIGTHMLSNLIATLKKYGMLAVLGI
jgi:hypothetical protein